VYQGCRTHVSTTIADAAGRESSDVTVSAANFEACELFVIRIHQSLPVLLP